MSRTVMMIVAALFVGLAGVYAGKFALTILFGP
jgi:hypothetical protein